jgi:hypothetical protein
LGKQERLRYIRNIQEKRQSKLITYVTSDRPNFVVMIGSDTPRLFYDHLIGLGNEIPKLDLFLYSAGGDTSVPWRIISLFREFADEINILVPYRAYSAATLLALGGDNILMGRKGELGPIDPTVNSEFNPVDPIISNRRLPINVEDITSYINLLKEKVGLVHQPELGAGFNEMAKAINPVALGYVNRHYSFIRMVATKLLKSHNEPVSETKLQDIVKDLIERIYFHGHGIARKEAKDLGLKVNAPNQETEELMWKLYLEYEHELLLQQIFNPEDILDSQNTDTYLLNNVIGAFIESETFSNVYKTDMKVSVRRATPQALNLNINFQLPVGLDPNSANQRQLQEWHAIIQRIVMEEIRNQSNVIGYEPHGVRMRWEKEQWL